MKFNENIKKIFSDRFLTNKEQEVLKERSFYLDKFLNIGLPTLKHEDWKYTNLSFLHNFDFGLLQNEYSFDPKVVYDSLNFLENKRNFVVPIANGKLNYFNGNSTDLVKVHHLDDASIFNNNSILQKFHKFLNSSNPFGYLSLAMFSSSVFLKVEDKTELNEPIILFYYYDADYPSISNTFSFVEVGEDSRVNIIVFFVNKSAQMVLANEFINLHAKRNAKVEINFVQNDLKNVALLNNLNLIAETNTTVGINTFTINTEFVRNNINFLFDGKHSNAFLNGVYIESMDEFVDNHTLVMHNQPNCISDENFRGILDGNSRAVFNGKIFVAPDAQKTNAYQSNKNLLLSNYARVNTRPQLEIYADDVRCTHGATAGFLDREMLFYITSRGISREKAKSLLLNSFVAENFEKVGISELRNYLKVLVAKKLNLEDIFFCSAIDELTKV